MRQVGYLQGIYRDARTTERKMDLIIFAILMLTCSHFMGLFLVSEPHILLKAESMFCAVNGQTSQYVGLYSLQAYRCSAYICACLFSLTCHVRYTA